MEGCRQRLVSPRQRTNREGIERRLSESYALPNTSDMTCIVVSPRIHHLVQGLNILPKDLRGALVWLRSRGDDLAIVETPEIFDALDAMKIERPTITFGCNNDSKRMYKFGNADGATVLDAHDEFKDNSADSGATFTECEYDEETREYKFNDDGTGMGLDKLREFSNLDSHNPDRDDTTTSGQHGIGAPRSLTCLARPTFDKNYRVTNDSSWTVHTKKKGTSTAYSLTCDYKKLNINNKYSDCFTFTPREGEDPNISYTEITIPINSDKVHNELIELTEKKVVKNLKENLYVKSAMTWNRPSNINGRHIDVMPNFFDVSTNSNYIPIEYTFHLYKWTNKKGIVMYPIRVEAKPTGEPRCLGWINPKIKRYSYDLEDDAKYDESDGQEDLERSVTLRLAVNKARYRVFETKKGCPVAVDTQSSPDEELVSFITPYLDPIATNYGSSNPRVRKTFNKEVVDVFFKNINVMMKN